MTSENTVELAIPATALARSNAYWGCYGCGKEIPESQVYCSEACRREQSGED